MKVALGQINPVIGDFEGNTAKILHFIAQARDKGAKLVIFPELSLCGYPPRDLLTRKEFIREAQVALEKIKAQTQEIAVVLGCPAPNPAPYGPRLLNQAVLLREGQVECTYAKALLPAYDVYEEPRYFHAQRETAIFSLEERRLGLTICEDIWNLPNFVPHLYAFDPVATLAAKGVEVIINISASPFFLGKGEIRRRLLEAQAQRSKAFVLYCNQVGANDHLVFDGHSLIIDPQGRLLACGRDFEEDLVFCDLEKGEGEIHPVAQRWEESLLKALITGVRDYFAKTGFQRAVVGLSGGIDSSVTASVAVRALGSENVVGVLMPSPYTSEASIEDALALAQNLGIKTHVLAIDEPFQAMCRVLETGVGEIKGLTRENLQARLRGNLLMALANQWGALVLNTGNKSEVAVGYCTLYGDTCGALAVLADIPKTWVYALAREINQSREIIPKRVLEKPPSAELRPGQTDEDDLPPYKMIDAIVKAFVEEGLSAQEIIERGWPEATVREVLRRLRVAEYKRWQYPPGLKVTPRAFGFGWRYPLAQRFRFEEH